MFGGIGLMELIVIAAICLAGPAVLVGLIYAAVRLAIRHERKTST